MNAPASLPRLALIFEVFLNIALVLCSLVALAGLGAAGIVVFTDSPPSWFAVGIDIETDPAPDYVVHTTTGTPVEVRNKLARIQLPIPPELRALSLGAIAATLIQVGFLAALLHQMRAFVHSLRMTQPFIAANALRLRRVAGLALVGFVIQSVMRFVLMFSVASHFPDLQLNITLSPDLNLLFFSITIFIIAEVFSIGVKMKEEQDLTV